MFCGPWEYRLSESVNKCFQHLLAWATDLWIFTDFDVSQLRPPVEQISVLSVDQAIAQDWSSKIFGNTKTTKDVREIRDGSRKGTWFVSNLLFCFPVLCISKHFDSSVLGLFSSWHSLSPGTSSGLASCTANGWLPQHSVGKVLQLSRFAGWPVALETFRPFAKIWKYLNVTLRIQIQFSR